MRKLSIMAWVAMIAAVSMADLTIPANIADVYTQNGGTTLRPVTETYYRVGQGAVADASTYQMSVIPFLLQDLPTGEKIDTAKLTIQIYLNNFANLSDGQSLDIIGVGFRTSPTVTSADFGGGTVVGDDVLWMDVSTRAPDVIGVHDFSTAGLVSFLQSVYDNPGYVSGSTYVFLKLAPSAVDSRANSYVTIYSANSTTGTVPTLTLTTIPEPATVGMLSLGTLVVLMVRRMRTK